MSTHGPRASCGAPVVRILVRPWRAVEPILKEIKQLFEEEENIEIYVGRSIFIAHGPGKKYVLDSQ